MQVQYLVAAYEEPAQVERLCSHLGDHVVVQWDCETPAPAIGHAEAVWPTRKPVTWGDGTQLAALLDSFEQLRTKSFDWLILLSGQDYPIRPQVELHRFLETSDRQLFLESSAEGLVGDPHSKPSAAWDHLARRYFFQYRWVPRPIWRWAPSRFLAHAGIRVADKLISSEALRVQYRPAGMPPGIGSRAQRTPFSIEMPCRKGGDWFALSRPVFDDLLNMCRTHPEITAYFFKTFIPTEAFFHTVLLPKWERSNGGRRLHFRRGSGARALLLDDSDLKAMRESGAFFARKFAPDAPVLDTIDELVSDCSQSK